MTTYKSPAIHQTPLYRARCAYRDMLRRCGKSGAYLNVRVKMTMADWLLWSVPKYEECLKLYPQESPSVSRFGDKGDYELTNVEIIPFKKNRALQQFPHQLRPDGTKICSRCLQQKPSEAFGRRKSTVDGLIRWCKACSLTYWLDYKKRKRGPVPRAAKGADS